MNEQIGVTYFPLFGGLGYHMALFYTNSTGVTTVIEVSPADQSLGPTDLATAFIQEQFLAAAIRTPPGSRSRTTPWHCRLSATLKNLC